MDYFLNKRLQELDKMSVKDRMNSILNYEKPPEKIEELLQKVTLRQYPEEVKCINKRVMKIKSYGPCDLREQNVRKYLLSLFVKNGIIDHSNIHVVVLHRINVFNELVLNEMQSEMFRYEEDYLRNKLMPYFRITSKSKTDFDVRLESLDSKPPNIRFQLIRKYVQPSNSIQKLVRKSKAFLKIWNNDILNCYYNEEQKKCKVSGKAFWIRLLYSQADSSRGNLHAFIIKHINKYQKNLYNDRLKKTCDAIFNHYYKYHKIMLKMSYYSNSLELFGMDPLEKACKDLEQAVKGFTTKVLFNCNSPYFPCVDEKGRYFPEDLANKICSYIY